LTTLAESTRANKTLIVQVSLVTYDPQDIFFTKYGTDATISTTHTTGVVFSDDYVSS